MGKQTMIKINNPREFADYIESLAEGETLTEMGEKLGYSRSFFTESILRRGTISLRGLCSLAAYIGAD